jgi:hypothetical protein
MYACVHVEMKARYIEFFGWLKYALYPIAITEAAAQ